MDYWWIFLLVSKSPLLFSFMSSLSSLLCMHCHVSCHIVALIEHHLPMCCCLLAITSFAHTLHACTFLTYFISLHHLLVSLCYSLIVCMLVYDVLLLFTSYLCWLLVSLSFFFFGCLLLTYFYSPIYLFCYVPFFFMCLFQVQPHLVLLLPFV